MICPAHFICAIHSDAKKAPHILISSKDSTVSVYTDVYFIMRLKSKSL